MNNRMLLIMIIASLVMLLSACVTRKNHARKESVLLQIDANDLIKLEWSNAAGRKEVITKEDGVWHYAGMEALDSTLMHSYLDQISNLQGTELSDITSISESPETEKLIIFGNTMTEPVTISAYHRADTAFQFYIQSSLNKESIFLSDSSGIYKKIFGDLRQFWPDGQ